MFTEGEVNQGHGSYIIWLVKIPYVRINVRHKSGLLYDFDIVVSYQILNFFFE